jgi:Glycosyl hydrolases family 31
MMRPMILEFPGDPTTAYLDRQYMLGPDVLVAPMMNAEGEVMFYVPAGLRVGRLRAAALVRAERGTTHAAADPGRGAPVRSGVLGDLSRRCRHR